MEPYPYGLTFSTHLSISLCWIIEAAAMVVITLSNGVGGASDWPDHLGIVLLLLVRATITMRTSLVALIDSLAPKVKAKRNEQLAIDRTKISRET
ncbi:hypothetical protein A4X09_0g7800 [Tilletia walkeri]|uniref:Uncharacterized protein n=1 Tax=Tilletia walkeri TaxID=117179 RepID=A0A8X7T0N9_9BASI|nr:hypothetical protein A4X09_0g7800 [Tilletia walkeri]